MIEGYIFRFAVNSGRRPPGALLRHRALSRAILPPVAYASACRVMGRRSHFIMSTPEHGDCASFVGGCAMCEEYYGRALRVQALWEDKARKLNIPLSAKGHSVAQVGTFTGVGIDTLRGRFYMLPEKLESTTPARDWQRPSSPHHTLSPVFAARHYTTAAPFRMSPWQPYPCRRLCTASNPELVQPMCWAIVPSLDAEMDAEFDWGKSIPLSARASRALAYLKEAMDRHGSAGQPLWPIITSSFYGAFLAGDLSGCKPLVITYDASIFGWGAIARTSASDPGFVVVGGFREAAGLDLLGAAYLEPAAIGNDPAAQVYRETLAGFLAVRAVSQRFALREHIVLVRGDCVGALTALRKGSFRSPALQNVALLFNEMFMRLTPHPPLFLHAPGEIMKAEGVDDLSRAVAADRRACESTGELRAIAVGEASKLGERFSIDLFATADNAIVPRFFARHAESLAEGQDALTQPDWGRSLCPHCGLVHREFAFVFPPRPLLAKTVAKARANSLRGVMVLPFATSNPVWLRRHSPTSKGSSTRASSSLPAPRMYDTPVSCLALSVWRSWLWTSRGPRTVGLAQWRHPVRRRRSCDLASLHKAKRITVIDAASKLPCIAPAWVAWRVLGHESPFGARAATGHGPQRPPAYYIRSVHLTFPHVHTRSGLTIRRAAFVVASHDRPCEPCCRLMLQLRTRASRTPPAAAPHLVRSTPPRRLIPPPPPHPTPPSAQLLYPLAATGVYCRFYHARHGHARGFALDPVIAPLVNTSGIGIAPSRMPPHSLSPRPPTSSLPPPLTHTH